MSSDLCINPESPFQPDKPVSPYLFKGRHTSIQKIIRYYNKSCNFDVQHFFLTGKKGTGKTSLAEFVKHYLEDNHNALGIYVPIKGSYTLAELVNSIFEAFLNKVDRSFFEKSFESLFGGTGSIEFKGTEIRFKPDMETSKELVFSFHYILNDLVKEFDDKSCIFLVIDDINGLYGQEEFVNWYKRFADTIEVDDSFELPLYVLFVGYPEKFDNLILHELSFGRIFHHEEISSLDEQDVGEFFTDAFESAGMKCEKEALDIRVLFSQGSPLMMQHIGDAVFWNADSELITKENATIGVLNAAEELESKLDLNRIGSKHYLNILLKLGKHRLYNFKKSDLGQFLSDDENSILNEFLVQMIKIGIITSAGFQDSDEYEFENILYFTYFMIKANEDEF